MREVSLVLKPLHPGQELLGHVGILLLQVGQVRLITHTSTGQYAVHCAHKLSKTRTSQQVSSLFSSVPPACTAGAWLSLRPLGVLYMPAAWREGRTAQCELKVPW